MRNKRESSEKQTGNKGAISVEYAFCMAIATIMMIGIDLLFKRISLEIIRFFEQLISNY